ncbi:hypothetical protein [Streptomyces sp. SP18CS02]|uniref:hypothetical protein n=1 Tax=Streptomyces sp. SP18CS02 TaxID=3002531 RepID=UPI002E79FC96|nr:hypothetical protein [Streptomyces sp. SP18CS02]MEE1757253.1 hypothetical protein [Streptomyces sp. SP18CS02]
MTAPRVPGDIPLPEFPRLAELTAGEAGTTGHAVLDALLAGLRERAAAETVVAYYDDAP